MYQLFCARNTYAMGPHIVLEELGVDYEILEVEIFADNQPETFLAASPHARVPALIHPGGTIFESGAIALFLTEQHPEGGLGVPHGHGMRAGFLQWLFYISSTLQSEVLIQFHPEFHAQTVSRRENLRQASAARLDRIWQTLDRAYAGKTWLIGDRLTAVDVLLGIHLQWPECFLGGLARFSNLRRMSDALTDRAAVREVMRWHGL